MNAHILTVGDEILIGQTINTNAAYIGSELVKNNIRVSKTSVIGDVEEEIMNEFRDCFSKNDILIVTGGLGPTHDDITRQCIVKFFNTELVINEEVLKDVTAFFTKRGRKLTRINEEQALVPKIASVIKNGRGTAPGTWIEKNGKIFVSMPGVPFEMMGMMQEYVIPRLRERTKNPESCTRMRTLQTTGIPESYLYERLAGENIEELLGGAKLAFLPSQFGVKLRITVTESTEEAAQNKLTEIEQKIRNKAGRYIFGKEEEQLEEIVARILKERELTVSLAESCTGGLISHMLTNINGSSKYYERGVVSYSNASKVELLEVDEDVIEKNGAVSPEVAQQMAAGVKSISGASIGIAVTGIMGPTGATKDKPLGLVYIGLCDDNVCTAKKFVFGDDRLLNKQRTAQAALEMLRRHLLNISDD